MDYIKIKLGTKSINTHWHEYVNRNFKLPVWFLSDSRSLMVKFSLWHTKEMKTNVRIFFQNKSIYDNFESCGMKALFLKHYFDSFLRFAIRKKMGRNGEVVSKYIGYSSKSGIQT